MGRGGGLRPASALGGRISPAPGKDHDDEIGEWVTVISKFHFVDLAGSERVSLDHCIPFSAAEMFPS